MPEIEELVEAWGIGPVLAVEIPGLGSMNETWMITTADRPVVLRRHRVQRRSVVEREHRVIAHIADMGIPAPYLIANPAGEQIVERDGHYYSLYSHAPGVQVLRTELTTDAAAAMGAMLAEIHLALRSYDAGPPEAQEPQELEATLARIERVSRAIRAVERMAPHSGVRRVRAAR